MQKYNFLGFLPHKQQSDFLFRPLCQRTFNCFSKNTQSQFIFRRRSNAAPTNNLEPHTSLRKNDNTVETTGVEASYSTSCKKDPEDYVDPGVQETNVSDCDDGGCVNSDQDSKCSNKYDTQGYVLPSGLGAESFFSDLHKCDQPVGHNSGQPSWIYEEIP